MKKRNISYKSIIILLIAIIFILTLCGFNSKQKKVYDEADLFSSTEENTLESQALSVAEQLELDVVILTIDDSEGLDTYQYMEEFYYDNDFGYNGNAGVALIIDMENRNMEIYYSEDAKSVLSDTQTDAMTKQIVSYLSDGDYYKACKKFLDILPEYADGSFKEDDIADSNGYQKYDDTDPKYNPNTDYSEQDNSAWGKFKQYWLIYLGIAVLISSLTVGVMGFQQKTHMAANNNTYLKNGINIRHQSDRFTHTTVVTRKIEQDHSSHSGGGGGGGGGGHSSGGGSGAHF